MTVFRLRYVKRYRDRNGHIRHYFRRKGRSDTALPGAPGSSEFMEAYQRALGTIPTAHPSRHGAGSLGQLVTDYYRSAEFANLKPQSRKAYRWVLGGLVEKHGRRLVADMPRDKARKIIEGIGVTRPGMANMMRAVLRRLLAFAVAEGWRNDNPMTGIKGYRLGTQHTWTEAELTAYEQRWPLGTRERLAYALLLYTGQRGGDVVRMRRGDIVKGAVHVRQEKTGKDLIIPVHPILVRALKAGPTNGLYLIGDQYGRKITRDGLTRLIRGAVKAAGLPPECKAHGLRKAALRRLAELGKSSRELAAVSGHQSLKEVERYTAAADQERLARAAIGSLPDE
jgi:integrase